MGLLTKKKYIYMPYGPTGIFLFFVSRPITQRKIYALWAYSQRKYMPYGPTHKE